MLQEKALPASFRQRSAMPFQVVSFKKNENKDQENEFEQGLQQGHDEENLGGDDGANQETGAEKLLMAMGWTPEDAKRALADEREADVCVAVSWRKAANFLPFMMKVYVA